MVIREIQMPNSDAPCMRYINSVFYAPVICGVSVFVSVLVYIRL